MNNFETFTILRPPDVLKRVSELRGPFLMILDDSESSAHALYEQKKKLGKIFTELGATGSQRWTNSQTSKLIGNFRMSSLNNHMVSLILWDMLNCSYLKINENQ